MAANSNITNLSATEGEIAEAAALLSALYFMFEHADNAQDWFAQRENIGWMITTIERVVRKAGTSNDRCWRDFYAANNNGRVAH